MLEQKSHINELFKIKHKHDNLKNIAYNYENDLLNKTLSPVLFKNNNLNDYLKQLQTLIVLRIDSVSLVRNKFNHIVCKYYNKYNK
jgi:hypothetical protein